MVKENIIKLIVAQLSKCHYPGKTNSVQEGPNVGLPFRHRQGLGGTVPHYSLVNLQGVLKPSLGLDLIDPWSSYML